MVDEIRNKWCDDLEELLQCPYCMILPQSDIRQCAKGHHVCKSCHGQHAVCPTCTSGWSSARNRLAEDLCSKLNDMKLSLIDPESEINKLLIPDSVSIACQTDGSSPLKIAEKICESPQGSYPCRIGTCNIFRLFEPLMQHLKTEHPDRFLQLPQEDNVFKHTWTFEVTDNMNFDWAVQITDMGTFFLKLSTDFFGDLVGCVMMVQNAAISKNYLYQLQMTCCAQHTLPTYYGTVRTCRSTGGSFPENSWHIKRAELQKMNDHTKHLECNLVLSKKNCTETPNRSQLAQKKNRRKRNRNAAKPPTAGDQNRPTANGQCGSTSGPSNGLVPANVRYAQSVSVLDERGMGNRRPYYNPFDMSTW